MEAIRKCLGQPQTYGKAYNICEREPVTYGRLADALLKVCGDAVEEYPMTIDQAVKQGVPLPFAVREQETELYDNTRSLQELGMVYTGLEEGMGKTYRAFRNVFANRR